MKLSSFKDFMSDRGKTISRLMNPSLDTRSKSIQTTEKTPNTNVRHQGTGATTATHLVAMRHQNDDDHPKVAFIKKSVHNQIPVTPEEANEIKTMKGLIDFDEEHPKEISNSGIELAFCPKSQHFVLRRK